MKRLLLIAISLLALHTVHAGGGNFGRQQGVGGYKKFSFSFNAGFGIPTGGFANHDSIRRYDTTHAHGFAKTGFHFQVDLSYRITEYVGVAASLGGTLCKFDTTAYRTAYGINPDQNVGSQGDHFIAHYLFGPIFFIPASKYVDIEVKALFGIVSAQYPDISIASNLPNNYSSQTYKFAHAQNFGYGFFATAKIKLDDMIGLPISVGYVGSSMIYPGQSYTLVTPSGFTYGGFSFSDRSMNLGIVTVTAGLSISF